MATMSGLSVLRFENKDKNTRLLPQQLCWKILREDWGEAREGLDWGEAREGLASLQAVLLFFF
jgi:hypothetical protein